MKSGLIPRQSNDKSWAWGPNDVNHSLNEAIQRPTQGDYGPRWHTSGVLFQLLWVWVWGSAEKQGLGGS